MWPPFSLSQTFLALILLPWDFLSGPKATSTKILGDRTISLWLGTTHWNIQRLKMQSFFVPRTSNDNCLFPGRIFIVLVIRCVKWKTFVLFSCRLFSLLFKIESVLCQSRKSFRNRQFFRQIISAPQFPETSHFQANFQKQPKLERVSNFCFHV